MSITTIIGRALGRPTKLRMLLSALLVATPPLVLVALILDYWQVAVIALVTLQALSLIVLLDLRARKATVIQAEKATAAAERVERHIANAETRMQASVDKGRLEMNDSITNLRESVAALLDNATDGIERSKQLEKRLTTSLFPHQLRQVEALLQLFSRVSPRAKMPASAGWALDPASILSLLDLVADKRPATIVELGSGSSSVWLGYALEASDGGRLITIDHEEKYAEATRAAVMAHSLEDRVEVRLAPLVEVDLPGHNTPWYEPAAFEDIRSIDLLVIDGPPKAVGTHSRYPAVPLLFEALTTESVIALDDVDREDESAIVERWCAEYELGYPDGGDLGTSMVTLVRQ